MNQFSGIGRIGKDAVVRHTSSGKAVTGWSVAIDRGWGENKQTIWLDCSWWGDRGTKVSEYIRRGDRIGVVGEIGTRDHDGKTYVTLDVRDVTLLGNGERSQGGGTERPKPTTRPDRYAPTEAPADDGFEDEIPFVRSDSIY
jgi:single-strand DNA-binding protein